MPDEDRAPPAHPYTTGLFAGSMRPAGPFRRCAAVTASGGRCRNACAPGSHLCGVHRARERAKPGQPGASRPPL